MIFTYSGLLFGCLAPAIFLRVRLDSIRSLSPLNRDGLMISWRMVVLFVHVTAVIAALGGSLFATFALAPILADELDD